METRESEEERQGGAWRLRASRRKQEVARGSRRWPGRVAARAGRVPVLLAEEEGDSGVAVAGWAAGEAGPAGLDR